MAYALRSVLLLVALGSAPITEAFIQTRPSGMTQQRLDTCPSALLSSASELLYQDQQEAMLRRALHEEELLSEKNKPTELQAAKIKAGPPKAGTGFANKAAMNPAARLAAEQAKLMKRDGVIRINNVLSPEVADKLRKYLLDQQVLVEQETKRNPRASKVYYGVEQARKNRE